MMELAGTKWCKCLLLGQDLFHCVLGVVDVLVPASAASAASAASVKGHRLHNVRYAGYMRGEIRLRSGHIVSIRSLRSALLYLSNDPEQALDQFCNLSSKGFQRIPKDSKERIPKDSIKQPETVIFAVMPGPTMLEWMAGTVSDHKPQGRGKRVLTYFINICKQYANMQTVL